MRSMMEESDIRYIRSKRRTYSLEVQLSGEVIVRAPRYASDRSVQKFIEKHKGWIEARIRHVQEHAKYTIRFPLEDGDCISLFGVEVPVSMHGDVSGAVRIKGDGRKKHYAYLAEFYSQQLTKWVFPVLLEKAKNHDLPVTKVRTSHAHARWGSCSSKGTISLAWRCAALPPDIVQYIIVHELAHLKYLSHGPRFWSTVERMYPTYRLARKWLRMNEYRFSIPPIR